ncbi:hypothetical protein CMI37_14830 [Candidatus Pacearchaeota archaeon]|nr:hypothetical protein [Candidatus Pacearchaeota archaeon]|tara:strand:+ start:520 stop:960 length:441 start_codon:yes stop_codon:yes gene_type:complete
MASLISATEKESLTGIFGDIFDTFKRTIVVHKEPVRKVQQINLTNIFGYGEPSNQTNFEYVEQYQEIDAVVRYKSNHGFQDIEDSNMQYIDGDASIKVNQTGKDYIKSGKTEKIIVDGKTFNVNGEEIVQRFLDSEYYIFNLKLTS